MELFNLHIQQVISPVSAESVRVRVRTSMSVTGAPTPLPVTQGRDLCSKLSVLSSVIKTPPSQLQSQLAIEVVSPILANSQNPLPVPR